MKLNDKIETINKRLDAIEKRLPKLSSEVDSEQKVLNEEIDELLNELDEYSVYINYELNQEIKNMLSDHSKDLSKYEEQITILEYISNLDKREKYYVSSSGFDELLYKMSYAKDVDIINTNIKLMIDRFSEYDIALNIDDFNYSYFTMKYMKEFLSNLDSNDFYTKMKRYFDEIYWICPNIIKHLVLNFIGLLEKYKKQIMKNILLKREEMLQKNDLKEDDISNRCISFKVSFETNSLKDTSYLYEFLSLKPDLLKKFLSFNHDQIEKKYMTSNNITDYELFIDNIRNYRFNLIEYVNIIKFKYILDYVIDLINKKTKPNMIDREISKLLKKKNLYNYKIMKLNTSKEKNNLLKGKINQIDKKIRINNAYVIDVIDKIYKLQIEKNIQELNVDILENINDNSTIYEALNIISKHYMAITNIMYDTHNDMDILNEIQILKSFVNSKETFIIKNTPLEKINNIANMIEKKYTLCNINTSINYDDIEEITKTIEELLYLEIYFNLKNKKLSLNDINICISNG